MRLSHLTNKILLLDIKNLIQDERQSTLQILFHLKEIDRRKLFSDLRFSSLFDYCVKDLGYSEGAAQRRIVAARMLEAIPEMAEKIESGKLSLTNISQVNQFYKDPSEQWEILKEVEGLSKKECEKKLFELSGKENIPKDKQKRVSKDKIQVAIVLDDKTINLMEKVKSLIGKDMPSDELIQFAMTTAIEKIEKSKFKQTEKPKSPPLAKVGRHISASVKRDVYLRDKKCVKCGSVHNLNFDHRIAYAYGGSSDSGNIRLLCFHCNQRARMGMGTGPPKKPRDLKR